MSQEFKFRAFISYKHTELDSAVAGKLQKTLEHYHVPKDIQKKTGNVSVGRIFRDEEELAVASDLFNQLAENIRQSEYLIVICSPNSKNAEWVKKEIETFLKYRDREHILAVLVEGEPENAFPDLLLGDQEPLAFDLRGKNAGEVLHNCSTKLPRLIAPLIGCRYDDLINRQKIYRMRRMMAITGVLLVAAVVAGLVLLQKNREITANYQGKLENQSRYLAKTADTLLENGDRDTALLVALEALPKEDTERPVVAEAASVLTEALYLYKDDSVTLGSFHPTGFQTVDNDLTGRYSRSPEEHLMLVLDASGTAYILDSDTLELKQKFTGNYKDGKLLGDGRAVIRTEDAAECYDVEAGNLLWSTEIMKEESFSTFFDTSDFLWCYQKEAGNLILAPFFWRVEAGEKEDQIKISELSQMQMVNVTDGSITNWTPADCYKDRTEGEEQYCRDLQITKDGSEAGIVLQTETGEDKDASFSTKLYRTDVYFYPVGQDQCSFHASFADSHNFARLVWADEDTVGILIADNEPNSVQFTYSTEYPPLRFTVHVMDRRTGKEIGSYSDKAFLSEMDLDSRSGILDDGTEIAFIRIGNLVLTLNPKNGELKNRVEANSIAVGEMVTSNSVGTSYLFYSDGSFQIRGVAGDFFPDERFNAYHHKLEIGKLSAMFLMNDQYYLLADNRVYCYKEIVDQTQRNEFDFHINNLKWSPDGRYALCSAKKENDYKVFVLDMEAAELVYEDTCALAPDYSKFGWTSEDTIAYVAPDETSVCFYTIGALENVSAKLDDYMKGFRLAPGGAAGGVLCYRYTEYAWSGENSQDREAAVLIDPATGAKLKSFTWKDIFGQAEGFEKAFTYALVGAGITSDSRYCMFIGGVANADASDSFETDCAVIYSMEEGSFQMVPGIEKVRNKSLVYYYDGWISPAEPVFFLMEDENELTFVNAETKEVLYKYYPETGLDGNEASFSPDGNTIVHQNGKKILCVHDWKNQKTIQVMPKEEKAWAEMDFFQDGNLLILRENYALSSTLCAIYEKGSDGTYSEIEHFAAEAASHSSVVTSPGNEFTRIYKRLTLDEKIARAREIVGDRQLDDVEKRTYMAE